MENLTDPALVKEVPEGPVLPMANLDQWLSKAVLRRGSLILETEEWGPLMLTLEMNQRFISISENPQAEDAQHRFCIQLPRGARYNAHLVAESGERPAILLPQEEKSEKKWVLGYSPILDVAEDVSLKTLPFIRSKRINQHSRYTASATFGVPDAPQSKLLLAIIAGQEKNGAVGGLQTIGEPLREEMKKVGMAHLLIGSTAPKPPTPQKSFDPTHALGAFGLVIQAPSVVGDHRKSAKN